MNLTSKERALLAGAIAKQQVDFKRSLTAYKEIQNLTEADKRAYAWLRDAVDTLDELAVKLLDYPVS